MLVPQWDNNSPAECDFFVALGGGSIWKLLKYPLFGLRLGWEFLAQKLLYGGESRNHFDPRGIENATICTCYFTDRTLLQ